jgi:hypothetical protein
MDEAETKQLLVNILENQIVLMQYCLSVCENAKVQRELSYRLTNAKEVHDQQEEKASYDFLEAAIKYHKYDLIDKEY